MMHVSVFFLTFAVMNLTTIRHIASWILLAVFVPMLLLSSLHVHEEAASLWDTECTDCVHHCCHGHLSQAVSWVHDCVTCQFLTLTMLTAIAVTVALFVHVCRKYHAQPLCGHYAVCCGTKDTRGPPSFDFI